MPLRRLTSAEMVSDGWKYRRSQSGCPRLIAPDGQVWTRCVIGRPVLAMMDADGGETLLRPTFRSARSLLRLMNVPRTGVT